MPEYLVWCPYQGETEDDAESITADSPRGAVLAWVVDYDEDHNIACDDDSETAHVRLSTGGETTRWLVWGSLVPVYYAEESKEML